MRDKKLSPSVGLELKEAVEKSGSADLKAQLDAALPASTLLDEYAAVLYGGNLEEGEGIFYYNGTAQCTKCHAINDNGGIVGPSLTHIGSTLKREQIMEALVEPSARISPGYGNVALKLKDGQVVYGILTKETDTALTITTSDAEPLIVPLSRIEKRDNLPSSMPSMHETLSKREIRDLVAFLVTLK
jgi:putative heme-binding domain-containing protein